MAAGAISEETKIIYHIDDEDTPYLIKLAVPPDKVTLADLKTALNRPNFKFFFKSMDDDFGVVKEELIDDDAHLPCFNGRVVSWLVTAESSNHSSDTPVTSGSGVVVVGGGGSVGCDVKLNSGGDSGGGSSSKERVGGIGNSRPPSFHPASTADQDSNLYGTCNDTDSLLSNRRDNGGGHGGGRPAARHRTYHGFDAMSSVVGSDLDSVSMIDSEDTRSRFSSVTGTTSQSSMYGRNRRKKFRHRMMPPISQASSFSSITDSTMSLNIVTVTLNMDTVNFLGISIVGQTNKGGDGGIYVGSIMKGGAVAQDGRIEPGDMILEVNGMSFEDMSNDEAVRTLRAAAQRPGPVTLVVAKCWDPSPKGYLMAPRQEPVRPIDPSAWVAHTEAVTAMYGRLGPPPSVIGGSSIGSPASLMATIPESNLDMTTNYSSVTSSATLNSNRSTFEHAPLTIHSDAMHIVRTMALPESGLEIRDRLWLKITIPNAFIGSDLVTWLLSRVEGFADRREAKKYACGLLKAGYIRHTVNKLSFSEQCYYTIADVCMDMHGLILDDLDSASELEPMETRLYDTLGPPTGPPSWATNNQYSTKPYMPSYLPPPAGTGGYMPPPPPCSNSYLPPPVMNYVPPAPYNFVNDALSLDSLLIANGADTVRSSSDSTESGQSQVRARKAQQQAANDAAAAKAANETAVKQAAIVSPVRQQAPLPSSLLSSSSSPPTVTPAALKENGAETEQAIAVQ